MPKHSLLQRDAKILCYGKGEVVFSSFLHLFISYLYFFLLSKEGLK